MKKIIFCLVSLSLIYILGSCTIDIPSSNKNNNNNQLTPPESPYPSDGAMEVSVTPQLSWSWNSCNNNCWYDVYLDTCNPPNYMEISGSYSNYYPVNSPLIGGKTYYWKICANNESGGCTGNVWRFTTTGGGLPTDGLVAYYPFKGNANDESGYSNNGNNNGASLTPDRFSNSNSAYSFNGSSSYIYVSHSSSLQPTGGLTLSAWVKIDNLNNTSSLLAKGSDNSVGMYSLRYESSNHSFYFQINFSDFVPGTQIVVNSTTTTQSNIWYNVIGVFDGTYMKIYINGQNENSIFANSSLGNNTEVLEIGSCDEGYFLNGALDDIRIYNRALNDAETLQLYHEGGWQKK